MRKTGKCLSQFQTLHYSYINTTLDTLAPTATTSTATTTTAARSHYSTLVRSTTLIKVLYITPRHITLHCATLTHLQSHYFTPRWATLHCATLHVITVRPQHHQTCNCNILQLHYCATLIIYIYIIYRNDNLTTLQLQVQLHYNTLHPAVVGEVTGQMTTAIIAAIPKNTSPCTFQSISAFALPSLNHNNQALL